MRAFRQGGGQEPRHDDENLHGMFRASVWLGRKWGVRWPGQEMRGGQGTRAGEATGPSTVRLKRVCAKYGEHFMSILRSKRESC